MRRTIIQWWVVISPLQQVAGYVRVVGMTTDCYLPMLTHLSVMLFTPAADCYRGVMPASPLPHYYTLFPNPLPITPAACR